MYSEVENTKKWRSIEEVSTDVQEVSGSGMFAWNPVARRMGPGGAMVGRTWVAATGTGEKADGDYWLKVTIGQAGQTAQVVSTAGAKTDTTCYIPIYRIRNGRVAEDLRGAFAVPCWE